MISWYSVLCFYVKELAKQNTVHFISSKSDHWFPRNSKLKFRIRTLFCNCMYSGFPCKLVEKIVKKVTAKRGQNPAYWRKKCNSSWNLQFSYLIWCFCDGQCWIALNQDFSERNRKDGATRWRPSWILFEWVEKLLQTAHKSWIWNQNQM